MKRTIPEEDAAKITLYMRTYYSLLRTTDMVNIRTLEETHIAMDSSLHPDAGEMEPDMSAFVYTSLRLPTCILNTNLVLLGQSEEVFRRRGYPDVESWLPVSAPARRRRMLFNGEDTLAAYIVSISDIDDIVPMLTAFQIEWNKMHTLLRLDPQLMATLKQLPFAEVGVRAEEGTGEAGEVAEIVAGPPMLDAELLERVRTTLRLSMDDWTRLTTIWGTNLPRLLAYVARQRKRLAVRLLAGSHIDYRRATQRWWSRVNQMTRCDLMERPIYFISSNTHSVVNMLSGFAQLHEDRLLAYLESRADVALYAEAQRIREREVPSNWANFLYYVLKKFLNDSPEGALLCQERDAYEAERGITRIPSQHTFDLEIQVIDLARLQAAELDPRLRDNLPLERLRESQALILNVDYPLGFGAYHLLTRIAVNVAELRGAYFIGKAATLNGRIGDVLIPNVVYDEHSENTYLFNNVFSAQHVAPFLVYGDVLDNQRAIAVRGTFLQNRSYMEAFLKQGYTDVEMESGPYLSALYEFMRPQRYPNDELVNLYPIPFEIGILHYASDTPMSKGKNLGSGNLSYYGMDPTYATTVAVLRRILMFETARQTQARSEEE